MAEWKPEHFTVRLEGFAELDMDIREALAQLPKGVLSVMGRATLTVASEVLTSMKPGTGRVYRRKGRMHTASAPMQPPAVDTGVYRGRISYEVRQTPSVIQGIVGTIDKRGPWLELGTKRMAPRPHFFPALNRKAAEIVGMFEGVIDGICASIVRD